MKKIMFVGSVGVGKTTLTQRLKGLDIEYFKRRLFNSTIVLLIRQENFYNTDAITMR